MNIGLLRTVHARLQKADADYDGHRVRAMEHIAAAVHHLGSSSPLGLGAEGSGNPPQAQSDRILRDAIHTLSTTETSLGTGTNAAAHHHTAHTSVAEAIRELHAALSIR